MKLLRALLALAVCLGIQAGLGRLWPDSHRYLDFLALPLLWYGIGGAQRSAMLAGCAAGLLQDAWFQIGTFGINGFKKTLLGWAIGGLASRFDMNHVGGRVAAGVLVSLADSLLDVGLRAMLDQQQPLPGIGELLVRAATFGVVVLFAFGAMDRIQRQRELRRLA